MTTAVGTYGDLMGMLPTDPREVFIFAGAGVSMSAPTSLPLFDWLRDTLLTASHFQRYVPTAGPLTAEQRRVKGIQPEPFFFALESAGIDTQAWLARVLDPPTARPNTAHRVLAELCLAGARVWTVNFDTFIERALPGISVIAAPAEPPAHGQPGELLKPHGSLGTRLIVTPQETLTAPPHAWRARLRHDLSQCRHVAFIGYSGRDFDFRHQWNEVLTEQTVWWFDMPGKDLDYKRHLLRNTTAQQRLQFPRAEPHHSPDGNEFFNPAWDFVRWCREHGLARVPDDALDSLLAERITHPVPDAPEGTDVAQAEIAALIGDTAAARALLRRATKEPTQRAHARQRLRTMFWNTPSRRARTLSSMWWMIPPSTRFADGRRRIRDKHLTQLSNATDHRRVIALTDHLVKHGQLSDAALGLRLAAMKMQGDVAEVIALARHAVLESQSDNNAVRCSAALHWCHALLWAGRYRDLRYALDDHFRPLANITNVRWMAWADYIEACLLIAEPVPQDSPERAEDITDLLDAAEGRFRAEANPAVVDIMTVRLTVLRQRKDITGYGNLARELRWAHRTQPMASFAAQAALLELAQMYGYHLDDVGSGSRIAQSLCNSHFPVHAALAHCLCAQWTTTSEESDRLLRRAIDIAQPCGIDRIVSFAGEVLQLPTPRRNESELFFP
jgi:hypothetical protein